MTTSTPSWPRERGHRRGLELQFGATRAELVGRALTTGDPLADAVVEAIQRHGSSLRIQLGQGLHHGLGTLEDPHPAVAELLASTENLPDYATDELLDHGSLAFFTMPPAAHIISLSAGALIRVYQSPSITNVLMTTGRLVEGADRRIRETGSWVNTAMLPGSLRPGAPGYVATIQVRMLHAQMRRLARTRSVDEESFGVPINQVDLARTWMDFTVTMLDAEATMGFGLTSSETADLYRYWWVIAHLLGIDPELVEGIESNDQAHRVDAMFQAVTGPLIPDSSVLASATLSSISGLLHQILKVPPTLGGLALNDLARRFHPSAIAEELGLRRNVVAEKALDVAIARVRSSRATLRRDPERWAREQQKQLAATRKLVAKGSVALYATGAE
ncbi:oxygenase MpaB family protein [Brachybacterium sacelli]|uniref:ER-bound oxygenase mpaB/mpaB'/Rubber oxygenase catalytic domain-containing protein n=1 Tax=Brachybacterium sacelli TaxID=173364 RepID=A0ABS4WYD6_9MICO|nr:oxygenase MpaB family protein [Brachybacterium sacelli]MBP2381212.1 hypothetical protein [Brachybacterium sacelli]